MDDTKPDNSALLDKIKRLVEERGLNQEEFARMTRLNRHTIRQILNSEGDRRLRNATINACARALGLTVSELRSLPLERLLPRMAEASGSAQDDPLRRKYQQVTQAELKLWLERNADRARKLSEAELDELLAMQGSEGPLVAYGVETIVQRIERRKVLLERVRVIVPTKYLDLLEQMVGLIYEKVRPEE
jgi:transcriptional regulator with XRE-family HTH domain